MSYYERNLPHWIPPGQNLFVTWRLSGSLPIVVLEVLRREKSWTTGKRFVRFDRELDSTRAGPLWLRDRELANVVATVIHDASNNRLCRIHAYVIMPNHVHLLLEPRAELRQITHAIKRRSARECNSLLNPTGKCFWQGESFDHWVRNPVSFERIRLCIENNPVSAGLVKTAGDWPWSSASKRQGT
jgi:putative transposase